MIGLRGTDSDDTVSVGRGSEQDIGSVAGSPEEAVVDVDLFEVDDGFADAASAVSEDVEASAPVEPDPQVREVAITPAVLLLLGCLSLFELQFILVWTTQRICDLPRINPRNL